MNAKQLDSLKERVNRSRLRNKKYVAIVTPAEIYDLIVAYEQLLKSVIEMNAEIKAILGEDLALIPTYEPPKLSPVQQPWHGIGIDTGRIC